jgi:streptogramin lyase
MRGMVVFIVICVGAAAYATGGGAWVGDTWGGRMVKLSPNGSIVRTVGPFVYPYGVAIDPSDGSVWFTVNADTVVKMTAEGQELFRRSYNTEQICVNPSDGACWIRLHNPRGVARLDKGGTETANVPLGRANWVSSASNDGTAWVTDGTAGVIMRVSPAGSIISSFGGFSSAGACAAYAKDNSVSVIESGNIVRLNTAGSVVFRTPLASGFCVDVNHTDDASWAGAGSDLYKLDAAGSIVNTIAAGGMVNVVTVNSGDGSAWVAIYDLNSVAKYTATGSLLFRLPGFNKVKGMAAEQEPAYPAVAPASMGKVKALFR